MALGDNRLQAGLGLHHVGPRHQAGLVLIAGELQRTLGGRFGAGLQDELRFGQTHAPVGLDETDLGLKLGSAAVGLGRLHGGTARFDLGRDLAPQVRGPADGGAGLNVVGGTLAVAPQLGQRVLVQSQGAERTGIAAGTAAPRDAALAARPAALDVDADLRQAGCPRPRQCGLGLAQPGLGLHHRKIAGLQALQQILQDRILEGGTIDQADHRDAVIGLLTVPGHARLLAGITHRATGRPSRCAGIRAPGRSLVGSPRLLANGTVLADLRLGRGRRAFGTGRQMPAAVLLQRCFQRRGRHLVGCHHAAASQRQQQAGRQRGAAKESRHGHRGPSGHVRHENTLGNVEKG